MLYHESLRAIGLRDYITVHVNSNSALFDNKALTIEIHFLFNIHVLYYTVTFMSLLYIILRYVINYR